MLKGSATAGSSVGFKGIRYDSAVQMSGRIALEDVCLGKYVIRKARMFTVLDGLLEVSLARSAYFYYRDRVQAHGGEALAADAEAARVMTAPP